MKKLAPIALFAYNRPDHLKRVLTSLSNCELAEESELFVFADGPKDDASSIDIRRIKEVRHVVSERTWCGSCHLIASDLNKGLALSIIDGVTQIVKHYGKIIVLEDDILCSPCFLKYMNKALDEYENEKKVISITGYIYPIAKTLPETFFLRGADCWSWATWKRSWDLFEPNGKNLLREIEMNELQRDFDFDGTYPYTQMLKDQVEGKNSSWAIRWYASAYLKNKLTLYPAWPLVENIGLDGSGTHCGQSRILHQTLNLKCPHVGNISINECKQARSAVKKFFLSRNCKPISKKLSKFIKKKFNILRNALRLAQYAKHDIGSDAEKI
jgi:hypothetical protein